MGTTHTVSLKIIPAYKDSMGPADVTYSFNVEFECKVKLTQSLESKISHIFGVDPLPQIIPFTVTQEPNCNANILFPASSGSSSFFDVSVEPATPDSRMLATRRLFTANYDFIIDQSPSFDLE